MLGAPGFEPGLYRVKLLDRPCQIQDPDGLAWSVIRVAVLDRTGTILEAPLLAAPIPHVDMVEPELIAFGEHVAVVWSEGEHIDLCSGCFASHRERVVLVDPDTLAPTGDIAELSVPSGGLLSRRSAFVGTTLLTAASIQYHVFSDAALATFVCD